MLGSNLSNKVRIIGQNNRALIIIDFSHFANFTTEILRDNTNYYRIFVPFSIMVNFIGFFHSKLLCFHNLYIVHSYYSSSFVIVFHTSSSRYANLIHPIFFSLCEYKYYISLFVNFHYVFKKLV